MCDVPGVTCVGRDMNSVNPVLLLILIAEVCSGLCAWLCPQFLRWIAAHLLTRADVIDLSRRETERRMKYWLDELGLAPGWLDERCGRRAIQNAMAVPVAPEPEPKR